MTFRLIKAGLSLLLIGLLSACANNPSQPASQNQPTYSEVDELKLKRSQLQFEFARLTELWWQRAGQLVETSSTLPLWSNDPETIIEINRVLVVKINQLKQYIAELDEKVMARKKGELAGGKLTLTLKYGGYKATNQDKALAVAKTSIKLVQGETQLWAMFTKTGQALPQMWVTLSDNNDLFIDGQLIAQLEKSKELPSFITSVTLYGNQIYAAGKLDMMLAPEFAE
ncbi:hypothetical protein MED121_09393 [Marinomonas sp. MED121]|uniref:hypothetical protein n=1 Tax=Marinomonas sp. MED121 TaxID=314277 RepID=UPI00006900B5|nr:hypothetical protein [Marinomonas sp. MED121]EAQ65769.1 hypothetical protein MED121_09393 [Marinomonas sp. MED121]